MQDQIFTFETLLRRMQLDDGEIRSIYYASLFHVPVAL